MAAHVSLSRTSTSGVAGSVTMIILVPVSVWKQCRSKVSALSSSMPVQPSTGDSCVAMACSECLYSSTTESELRDLVLSAQRQPERSGDVLAISSAQALLVCIVDSTAHSIVSC